MNKKLMTKSELLDEAERMHRDAAHETETDRIYGGFTAEIGEAMAAENGARKLADDEMAVSLADYILPGFSQASDRRGGGDRADPDRASGRGHRLAIQLRRPKSWMTARHKQVPESLSSRADRR